MSEQEGNGLTLEGLAQRLEALEQAEAGTGQTGEETAGEFVGPASRGEQEYEGLTLQALARRLEMLEHENAVLRQQALDEAEARDVSTFDEVRCNVLRVADLAFLKGGGLSSDNYIPSIGGRPQAGVTANTVQPGGTGVTGGGLVGVLGWGLKKPGDTEVSVGVKGEGDDFGVWGRSFRADFWGVVGRNPIGGGVIGQGVVGVRGEGGDLRWVLPGRQGTVEASARKCRRQTYYRRAHQGRAIHGLGSDAVCVHGRRHPRLVEEVSNDPCTLRAIYPLR